MAAQTALLGAQRLAASTEKPPERDAIHGPGFACAQRLAASTEKPRGIACSFRLFCKGAQRLAASTEKPPFMSATLPPFMTSVLNALRHQRKNHPLGRNPIHSVPTCSTPCGINGKTTRFTRPSLLRMASAQRLAASTEKPPKG